MPILSWSWIVSRKSVKIDYCVWTIILWYTVITTDVNYGEWHPSQLDWRLTAMLLFRWDLGSSAIVVQCVCRQNISKNYERILMKFCKLMEHSPVRNRVMIPILMSILDHFPRFFSISRQGINRHFAVSQQRILMKFFGGVGRDPSNSQLAFLKGFFVYYCDSCK